MPYTREGNVTQSQCFPIPQSCFIHFQSFEYHDQSSDGWQLLNMDCNTSLVFPTTVRWAFNRNDLPLLATAFRVSQQQRNRLTSYRLSSFISRKNGNKTLFSWKIEATNFLRLDFRIKNQYHFIDGSFSSCSTPAKFLTFKFLIWKLIGYWPILSGSEKDVS